MGVHGLWQLLHPAGQPVSLESLEGKVLAVDISIWLHQTMKGMRDKDGNPLPNAHLQGLFSRVCKLLFYRIKPVFVFDGGVPALKKQTMAARRERRAEAEQESREISQKLLHNLIRSQAVRQTIGDAGGSQGHVPGVRKGRNQPDSDMFQLAPLPESEEIGLALNSEEWDKDFELQESWIKEGLAAVSDTHPDSEEFRSLPAEIQHEVLRELKEQKKYHSLSRINKMPEDSTDFSSYQLKKLMKQSRLTARIDEVRKQMSSNTADDITCSLGDEYCGDEVEARRIVSEDAAHYVLIKGLTKKRQQEEADKYEIQSRVKLEKVDEDDNDYGVERSAGDQSLIKDIPQSGHKDAKVQSSAMISSDSDSDLEAVINSRLRRKRRQKPVPSWSGQTGNPGAGPHQRAGQIVGECEVIYSSGRQHVNDVSCTSEDEGFIEVRVDPSAAAVDDDLFPASIFQAGMDSMCRDTIGAVGGLHPEKVAPASSDLIQTKNTLTNLNNSDKLSAGTGDKLSAGTGDKLSAGTGEEAWCEELGDTAFSSKHWGARKELLPQMAEIDDVTARRKNILNEILYQLEQKKKCLDVAQFDDCGDTVVPIDDCGDTVVPIDDCGDTVVPISAYEPMQVNHESDVDDNAIVKRSESKDLMPRYSVASCSKALSPEVTFSEAQEASGRFLINTLDEANSISESDEELKIAIELSLQSNRSDRNKCLQTTDCSLSGSLENSASTDVLKDHSVEETITGLLKPQEVNKKSHAEVTCDSDNDTEDFVEVESEQLLLENPEIITEDESLVDSETDIQEDTDADKSQDSDEFSRSVTESGERYHNQPHSPAVLEEQPVESSSGLLQPEDYDIDHDSMFQVMDRSNLEDARTRLESERSALLSERGRQTRMATSITEQTNLEAQELLQMFGIPFIVSPMEAEAQCAYLDITNQTAGTITDDSDIWLFGGRRMYKNFFNQSKHVEFFTYDGIYSHFGISRTQLINIALLCGSDYTEGIPGVGPVRALEILAEFPGDGLEGLSSFRKWWSRAKSQAFTSDNKVRARLKDLKIIPGFPSEAVVDAYLHPQVDDSLEKFTWGVPDLDMLREFTKYKFGWSREKTDQSLLPMMKQLSIKQSQGRIQMYFQPRHFAKTLKIQSERMKRALASMKNPRQTVAKEDQLQDNVSESVSTENTKQGHKGAKKRKAAENSENIAGGKSKHTAGTNKPVKQTSKKKVKTVEAVKERELKLVEKQVDITEEVATVAKTEPEVMIEQLELEDTEKDRSNVRNIIINRQKQVKEIKRMTLTKSRKNKAVVTDEQGLSIEGNREEKVVVVKQNPRHKQAGVRSDVIPKIRTSIDKGKSRRGRRVMGDKYIGGRGKVPVSLDETHITRGKHLRKGKTSTARGIVNLSESSSSGSDSSHESELSDMSKSGIPHAKQSHHSKNMPRSTAGRDIPEQSARLEATQKNTVVVTQVSERDTSGVTSQHSMTVPTGSQHHRRSSAGKKIYQEFLNGSLATDMSSELTQLKQKRTSSRMDGDAGNDETDNRTADVSVINRQNLPSTLTYLNRRSRQDQFLLHQLKGNRAANAVEKRLEAGQSKSMLDKQTCVNTGQAAGQDISFADMLGGLDVVAAQSVHSKGKGKKIFIDKKQSTINDSPTKTLQNKIFQQIGQFGSVLAGASSTDNSDAVSIKQRSNQSHLSDKGRHSQDIIHLISYDKQPLAVNKHLVTRHLMGETESKEKAVSSCSNASLVSSDIQESSRQIICSVKEKAVSSCSDASLVSSDIQESSRQIICSVKKDKTLKSSRSKAFDKPISDCSSDDSDRDARKLSKKNRFINQMEHLYDSKSVKGIGMLPRQNAEPAIRTKASKGIGKGKSHSNLAGISDKLKSKNTLEDELQEYAFITADDLGSDFSDCDI